MFWERKKRDIDGVIEKEVITAIEKGRKKVNE